MGNLYSIKINYNLLSKHKNKFLKNIRKQKKQLVFLRAPKHFNIGKHRVRMFNSKNYDIKTYINDFLNATKNLRNTETNIHNYAMIKNSGVLKTSTQTIFNYKKLHTEYYTNFINTPKNEIKQITASSTLKDFNFDNLFQTE